MRSTFSSSKLVRLLGEWAPADGEAPAMDFAERLSLWLNAFDAIGLQAAHRSIDAITTAAPTKGPAGRRPRPRPQSLEEDMQRVRGALAHAIAQDPLLLAGLPLPTGSQAQPQTRYTPFRQRHLELQRQMEQMIGALRDHVRQALGQASPRLRQLAALDAVLEQVLLPKEQMLLPTTATVLERRFEQLRRAHAAAASPEAEQDAGEWLQVFAGEWREALRAEVDLRLEPVTGLIRAFSSAPDDEMKNRQ